MASSTSGTEPTNGNSSSSESVKSQINPIRMPTMEEVRAQEVWDNCAVRSVVSGVMGGGFGFCMGLLLGSLENPIMEDQMAGKQKFIYQAKQMGQRSWRSAKTFAVMGLIFSAVECVVEKARAKHDMTNTVVAGCATGGAMSARGGPKAACIGCAGFAAFSVFIEKVFDTHS
ncbi:hypothetical protein SLE2022_198240 [Rubroshorea leprosula]